jgi:HSP20 family protein
MEENMTYYLSNLQIEARKRFMRNLIENSYDRERVMSFPMDLSATAEDYVLTAMLPGLTAEDVAIQFNNGVLTISGEYPDKRVEGDEYIFSELPVGKFNRAIEFNEPVKQDKIDAAMKQGLLTIHIPKAEEAKPKSIKIKVE